MAEPKENQILLVKPEGVVVDIPQWSAKIGTTQALPQCVRLNHMTKEAKDKVNRIFLALQKRTAQDETPEGKILKDRLLQFRNSYSALPLQFQLPVLYDEMVSEMTFDLALRYTDQLCQKSDIESAQNGIKAAFQAIRKNELMYELFNEALLAHSQEINLTIFAPYRFQDLNEIIEFLKIDYSNTADIENWQNIFKKNPNYITECRALSVGYFTQESLSALYFVPELETVPEGNMIISYSDAYRHLSFIGLDKKIKPAVYTLVHSYTQSLGAQTDEKALKTLFTKTQKNTEESLMVGHYKKGVLQKLTTPFKTKLKNAKKTLEMLNIFLEREKINSSLKDFKDMAPKVDMSRAKKFKI